MHAYRTFHSGTRVVPHLVNGEWRFEKGPIVGHSPWTGEPTFEFAPASRAFVDEAIAFAERGGREWARASAKDRARILFQVRDNILQSLPELRATVSFESGKTIAEAEAGLMKGIEVLEFALSLQNLDSGGRMEVSRGIHCEYRRAPLGVVAGITPFNFPAMVPMWMLPIALAVGNAFVWKPSDKVPMTSQLLGECFVKAGLPKGALTILQGGAETVNAIVDHASVRAIGFVGSTPVAKALYVRGTALGKRVLALGGAKNHLILAPDADPTIAAQGIADSFTGCAGQRCMAASVLIAIGSSPQVESILDAVVEKAKALRCGENMGAIISKAQVEFLSQAIERATSAGATLRLDGRGQRPETMPLGHWLGPTILDRVNANSEAATQELFGPVLSIVRVNSLDEALVLDSQNPFGNATSIFTTSGAVAEEVASRSESGMIGINVGVPVPREPFSFGGTFDSKFGHGDITGAPGVEFWSDLKKVTTKWSMPLDKNWMG
jgi:malonate-semialdehyde dehydrogenase (acetylating) / methylmalonate-semialdehyde dehydrogenase